MPYSPLFDGEELLSDEERALINKLIVQGDRMQPAQGLCVVCVSRKNHAPVYAWSDGSTLTSAGDEEHMERPFLFTTFARAMVRLNKLRDDSNIVSFTIPLLAWWWHEWETCLPIEKYQRMSQSRFPGSPRQ